MSGSDIPKAAGVSFADRTALVLSTWGVGYLPLAPGTWGSAVGVLLYLLWERAAGPYLGTGATGGRPTLLTAAVNSCAFLAVCVSGIWAAGRAARKLSVKDPQVVVVDEVMGQILTLMFVPFGSSWRVILAGFLLFRVFDVWKPYPIRRLERLGGGFGICADDLLAGIYAGVLLFFAAAFLL